MNGQIIFFAAIFGFFCVCHATYTDCGSNLGTLQSLTVTDCDENDDDCVLHRDTNVTIQIKFTPKEDIDQIKAIVHGVIVGVPIPFPLPNGNGCVDSGVTCPLKAGQEYTYFTTLPVLKKYPKVSVDVKFELQNTKSDDVTCTMIPSKIK